MRADSHRMHREVNLVSLLVLGWIWSLQGVPVLPEPLYPTQENFDLSRFSGKWYEVAVVSTCPHYMQRQRKDPIIGMLRLQEVPSEGIVKMTGAVPRGGTCKQTSADYGLTNTPGWFFYHVAKFGVDVDSYVVHTNYDEYALMIMLSTERSSMDKTIIVKLYSRTMEMNDTVLDDFKTLVREQGITDDAIIIKQNMGECVAGRKVAEPTASPQRIRRTVVLSVAATEQEGSGDDAALLRGSESCKAAPDAGPCFGMEQHFFYNASSMSCQMFTYGGCLGNQNNFATERECLQTCRTEAVCRLPTAAFPCKGQLPVWAFDSTSGLCLAYKQGFCQGNGNKFYSKAECEEYCGVVKDEEILTVS